MQSLQWPQGAPWQRLKSEVSRQNPFWLSSSMKLPCLLGFRSPMGGLWDPDDLGQGHFPLKSFDWCSQKSETMKLYLKRAPRESLSLGACVHANLLQSCLTLCDPMDCSLPSSSVHGILQARILEWVAIPLSGLPVITGHETTDWFQIGKGVHQGYTLSPCLFNFYAEYIMRYAGLGWSTS